MIKCILTSVILLLVSIVGFSQGSYINKLENLYYEIEQTNNYTKSKEREIEDLQKQRKNLLQNDLIAQYEICIKLYNNYKIFKYDSAYAYASECQKIAYKLVDPQRIAYSSVILNFTLLSSGLFKETADSLKVISIQNVNDSIKAKYYALQARYFYDIADYSKDDYYTPKYVILAGKYFDSALALFTPNSFSSLFYRGLRDIRLGNRDEAKSIFNKLISSKILSDHELALTASTLSDIYIKQGDVDTAISLLIDAAIADIKSSTKETSAMYNLAQLLYKKGDIKNASKFIEYAIEDASFFGSRQRKVQLISILPLIEAEKISQVESQKRNLIIYSVLLTILLIAVIYLVIIVYKQIGQLKRAKNIISEANQKEHQTNQQLAETVNMLSEMHVKEKEINKALLESNNKLAEANKIKAEYIFYFFYSNYDFFGRIDRFKNLVEKKLNDKKYNEIQFLINNVNIRNEKDELLKNFDKAFLNIFPNFVEQFNELFKPEDRIKLEKGEILNTDLRIFALIRMGIHEIVKISEILEYSVNTINTYKTRIKNKSIVDNDDFEFRIMKIESE